MEDAENIEQKPVPVPDQRELEISELRSKLEKYEADHKKTIEKREAEKKRAQEEAEKNGKLQEALDLVKDQLKSYQEKYNESEIEDLRKTKEKYSSLVESQKKAILEKFPEEKRIKFAQYELEQLMDIAGMIDLDVSIPSVESKKKSIGLNGSSKNWKDMSQQEREALYEADPSKARQLLNEYVKGKK